ncbi:MAG: CorA family divalent cation transporter [Aeoliella sp.]
MPTEPSLLPNSWQVPQQFRDRIGNRPGRQRVMEAQGNLLVVLHAPPVANEHVRTGRYYWRDDQGNWMPKGMRHGEHSLGELLDEYDAAIDRFEDRVEKAGTAEEHFEVLHELHPLVRAINNLHNTLIAARDLARGDRQLILLRDAAYGLARRADLLHADARTALEFHIAERTEEQAESGEQMATASHRLNLLVAFFFPIATLAGILGMNLYNPLEAMSERNGPQVLIGVLCFGLILGMLLTAFVTLPPKRRRKRKQS